PASRPCGRRARPDEPDALADRRGGPRGGPCDRVGRETAAAHRDGAPRPDLGGASVSGVSGPLGAGLAIGDRALDARARRAARERRAHRRRDPGGGRAELRRLDPPPPAAVLAERARLARTARRDRPRRVARVEPRAGAGAGPGRRGTDRRRGPAVARARGERSRVTAVIFGLAIGAGALAAL